MAVAFDSTAGSTIGKTGTGTGESANVTHAANAMVVIVISYLGTTSPSAVTVGGVSATSLDKKSLGSATTVEVFYIFRVSSATESVSVTFAANHRHTWSVSCYVGAASSSSWEGTVDATGSGSSAQTAAVTVAAGQANGRVISGCGAALAANANFTMAMAPANGETERREDELAGGVTAGLIPVGSQIQDFSDAGASHACQVTITVGGSGTIGWAIVGARLLPSSQSTTISDTASESDAAPTVAVAVPVTDTGSETDADPTITVAFTLSDTATETDADPSIGAAFTIPDTAVETDSDPVVVGGPFVSDTGSMSDSDPAISVALSIADFELESDADPGIVASFEIFDTALETDADPGIVIDVTIPDVGSLLDSDPAISVDLSIADLQALADSDPAIEALITILDSIADTQENVQVTMSSPGVIVIQLGEGRDIYPFE
jgi:hypothetical protein